MTARYVKLQGIERGLPYGYSLYEVEITRQEVMMTTSDIYNAAAGATVTCSGSENAGFSTAALVDEDTNTRWASNFADDAWFIIDLGAIKHFYEIELNWEAAYGKKYTISVSTDGMNYDTIVSQQNGKGGIESYDCNVSARYIKVQGIERALPYGYSLYEVQVQAAR